MVSRLNTAESLVDVVAIWEDEAHVEVEGGKVNVTGVGCGADV